jgi:hypothetical protein
LRALLFATTLSMLALTSANAFASDKDGLRADVKVVRSLYSEFAEEAVLEEPLPGKNFLEQPRPVLDRFLTPELSALLVKDRDCAARTHDICGVDFSPIWASQDPSGATVAVIPQADFGNVLVTVNYHNSGARKLIFRLTKGAAGWRIADIVYSDDGSTLSQLLQQAH